MRVYIVKQNEDYRLYGRVRMGENSIPKYFIYDVKKYEMFAEYKNIETAEKVFNELNHNNIR